MIFKSALGLILTSIALVAGSQPITTLEQLTLHPKSKGIEQQAITVRPCDALAGQRSSRELVNAPCKLRTSAIKRSTGGRTVSRLWGIGALWPSGLNLDPHRRLATENAEDPRQGTDKTDKSLKPRESPRVF